MPDHRHSPMTPARLIELLAQTDDALAALRSEKYARHPYRQAYVEAFVTRRQSLARKLRLREERASETGRLAAMIA